MALLTPRGRTALVSAMALQRLFELRVSARNRVRAGPASQASPRTYPAMVAVHVTLFAVCAWQRRGRRVPLPVEVVALTGVAAALALRMWVIRSLGTSWNVTAHVEPGLEVVTRGPYRRVRHPNYVAVMLEFACLPVAVGAFPEAVILSAANAAVLIPRVRAEESLLDDVPGYRAAFAGVPRFLPRPGRRSRQNPVSASQSRGERSRKLW
jgi:methyltransferase